MRDARPAELGRCPILIHKVRSGFLISRVKGAVIDHQLIIYNHCIAGFIAGSFCTQGRRPRRVYVLGGGRFSFQGG